MDWLDKRIYNRDQSKETAKMLLRICEVILIAIFAGQYISPIAKKLTIWDNAYGFILAILLYAGAMLLLVQNKKYVTK